MPSDTDLNDCVDTFNRSNVKADEVKKTGETLFLPVYETMAPHSRGILLHSFPERFEKKITQVGIHSF